MVDIINNRIQKYLKVFKAMDKFLSDDEIHEAIYHLVKYEPFSENELMAISDAIWREITPPKY